MAYVSALSNIFKRPLGILVTLRNSKTYIWQTAKLICKSQLVFLFVNTINSIRNEGKRRWQTCILFFFPQCLLFHHILFSIPDRFLENRVHEYTTFIKDFREYNVNIRKAYHCLASEFFFFCVVFFFYSTLFLLMSTFQGDMARMSPIFVFLTTIYLWTWTLSMPPETVF